MWSSVIWFLFAFSIHSVLAFPLPVEETSSPDCLPGNFSCAGDLRMTYNHLNVSLKAAMKTLGVDSNLKALYSCHPTNVSCHGRPCWKNEQRSTERSCYCDEICVRLGDCCYDYYDTCGKSDSVEEESKSQLMCHETFGVLMVTTCRPEVSEQEVSEACEHPNASDLLQQVPVYDENTGITYRNIFCAHCNNIVNSTFWRIVAKCTLDNTTAVDSSTHQPYTQKISTEQKRDPFSTRQPIQSQTQRKTPRFATLPPINPLTQSSKISTRQPHNVPSTPQPIQYYTQRKTSRFRTLPPINPLTQSSQTSTRQPHGVPSIPQPIESQTQRKTPRFATLPPYNPPTLYGPSVQIPTKRQNHPSAHQSDAFTNWRINSFNKDFIKQKCRLTFEQQEHFEIRHCIPQKVHCRADASQLLKDLCSFYHLPLYRSDKKSWDNPHCALCNRQALKGQTCVKGSSNGQLETPPLTIIFDFTSRNEYTVSVNGELRSRSTSCRNGEVYDPFAALCRNVAPKTILISSNMFCQKWVPVRLKNSEFEFRNSTIFVFSHNKTYSSELYHRDSDGVQLCTNFTANVSVDNTKLHGQKVSENEILQELTFFGCCLSEISLCILIFTYGVFRELRNLPGKNLICLSCAVAIYQGVFFASIAFHNRQICFAIAAALHYFLLVSMSWMNVLAFDVKRVFASQDGRVSHDEQSSMFVKYFVYAWGTPFLLVLMCLVLDLTGAVTIHYGVGRYCWIGNGTAALVVFGVPVALILVFNIVALTRTVLAIRKTHQVTRQIANRKPSTSQPVLYMKLTSVMGIPWVLGFMISLSENAAFLKYLFVGTNSLQGFFICLSFLCNKRVLGLYRALIHDIVSRVSRTGRDKTLSVSALTSATQNAKV